MEPNVKNVDSERQQDEADVATDQRVQLALPMQSNPDFYIIYQEWPEYPLEAPESERRTPVIFVNAAVFVNPDGLVSDAMITSTNGSRVYSQAVLAAIRKWKFGWRIDPGAGRWIEIPINFRSPYFSPGLPGSGSP